MSRQVIVTSTRDWSGQAKAFLFCFFMLPLYGIELRDDWGEDTWEQGSDYSCSYTSCTGSTVHWGHVFPPRRLVG